MNQQELDLAAQKLVAVEEAMLDLRKVLATGSMLKGWTLRSPTEIDKEQVLKYFAIAWCACEVVQNNLDDSIKE